MTAEAGQAPVKVPGGFIEGERTELAVRNLGLFESVEDFDQMIVATVDGRPIRLSDVGFTQLAVGDERGMARYNLTPTLGLGIAPRSGANLVDVNSAVRERMDELKQDFPAAKRMVSIDGQRLLIDSGDEKALGLAILVLH